MGRGRSVLALLLFFSCAVHYSQAQCLTTFQAGLANATTETGFQILTAALKAVSSTADAGIFPSAGDGVTLFAPDDNAFTNALENSGLSLSVAETTLGSKGAFTSKQLVAAASVQTDLGTYLKANLPLTFTASGATVNASGVTGTSVLGTPFAVCNSIVYPVSTVLLPSTSLSTVPDVLIASAPATAPAGSVVAGSVPPPPAPATLRMPPPPVTQPPPPTPVVAAAAPAPLAFTPAPMTAPLAGPAPVPAVAPAPVSAPVVAPVVAPASAPVISTPTPVASAPALVGGLTGLGLAPTGAPSSGAEPVSMPSTAAVLSSAAAGALALLFL